MSRDHMPTASELQAFLVSCGFDEDKVSPVISEADYVASAIEAWERATNYMPFLAGAADTTWYFDPPGARTAQNSGGGLYGGFYGAYGSWGSGALGGSNRLNLGMGFISITSVTVGLTPTNSTGTVLTDGTDYWLSPQNAPLQRQPYQSIQFGISQIGGQRSIKVIGRAGFAAAVPEDAYRAVLKMAAREVLPQLEVFQIGPLMSQSEGGVSEVYRTGGKSAYASLGEDWDKEIANKTSYYKRRSII